MQAGDIIFVKGDSIISKAITWIDEGQFSHCALCVSPTHIIESQRFVKSRIVPFYFDEDKYEIIDLGLSESERDAVVHIAIQLTGIKYDYVQLIGIMLEKLFHFNKKDFMNSPDKFICSEIVDIILYTLGKISDEEYIGDKSPNELYNYIMSHLPRLTSVE